MQNQTFTPLSYYKPYLFIFKQNHQWIIYRLEESPLSKSTKGRDHKRLISTTRYSHKPITEASSEGRIHFSGLTAYFWHMLPISPRDPLKGALMQHKLKEPVKEQSGASLFSLSLSLFFPPQFHQLQQIVQRKGYLPAPLLQATASQHFP